MAASSNRVVHAALAGNALVAITKFVAAWWTGSSAMLSEALHSCVDTGNQLLLLYGLLQARRPPDSSHPLGYGRELYFWSFIAALLMFALGVAQAGSLLLRQAARMRVPFPRGALGQFSLQREFSLQPFPLQGAQASPPAPRPAPETEPRNIDAPSQ